MVVVVLFLVVVAGRCVCMCVNVHLCVPDV